MVGSFLKVLAAIVGPWLIWAIYLYASRASKPLFNEVTDYFAAGVAIAFGLWAISKFNISKVSRVALSVAYVPLAGICLFVFAVGFVCSEFNSCL